MLHSNLQKVSEYDQEMPQSHTADQPTALWWRCTEQPHDSEKSKLSNLLSLPQRDDCKTRKNNKYSITKQGPNTKFPWTIGATTNNETTKTKLSTTLSKETKTNECDNIKLNITGLIIKNHLFITLQSLYNTVFEGYRSGPCNIYESCYKGTILQRNYRKSIIPL